MKHYYFKFQDGNEGVKKWKPKGQDKDIGLSIYFGNWKRDGIDSHISQLNKQLQAIRRWKTSENSFISKTYPNDPLYIFSWDNIPGNDNDRLIEFLKRYFDIEGVKTEDIKKINGDRTIKISAEKNSLSLKLNDATTKVNIEIDDGRNYEFIVKIEESKLNIYARRPQSIENELKQIGCFFSVKENYA